MNVFVKRKKQLTLEEITESLDKLRIPTALVFTPTNLEEEKKKFFDSDEYNPQFRYRKINNKNKSILEDLSGVEEISDVDPRISEFYIDLIKSKEEANNLMDAIGDNDLVTEISMNRYGKPSDKLFRNACRVLRGNVHNYKLIPSSTKSTEEPLLYDDIECIFNNVFLELGLEGWGVSKSMNIAKNGVKVGIKTKQILVDKNIQRSKLKLKKTIVHEVGTHVLRAVNGSRSGFLALGKANLPGYLDVEEGLATWNESNMGLLTEKWLRNKVALIYAIYVGKDMTFRQLYNCLFGILPKYSAFDAVYRVKRGMSDTSKPGIYTKDVVYFRGFKKVSNRLEKTPSLYNMLYSGKINFKQCEWVEEGLIPRATNIPTKERWVEIFKKVGL